jgi:hypothetical protein
MTDGGEVEGFKGQGSEEGVHREGSRFKRRWNALQFAI